MISFIVNPRLINDSLWLIELLAKSLAAAGDLCYRSCTLTSIVSSQSIPISRHHITTFGDNS